MTRRQAESSRAILLALLLAVVTAHAGDWPQFRGPTRDGHSPETGLLRTWPEGGPPQRWRSIPIGTGYSSPVVVGKHVLITGDRDGKLVITCLDKETGKFVWQSTNGRAWANPYPGARSSVTVVGKHAYHLNAHGRLLCLETTSGAEIWSMDVLARFGGANIRWGLSECLLVDGDRLIVTVGGSKAFLVALNRHDGKTVWASPPLKFMRTVAFGGRKVDPAQSDFDKPGYASPILLEVNGKRLVAATGSRHFVIADAETGVLLWTKEVPVRYEVIGTMPVWSGEGVLFCAPDMGATLYQIALSKDGAVTVTERWKHDLDNCHGGMIYADGCFLGSGYRKFKKWCRIDAESGETQYVLPGKFTKGSTLFAEGMMYALSEKGRMTLLEPLADGFRDAGSFALDAKPGNKVWAHPAIADGHLFLRLREHVTCHDIRREPQTK
ncbi:MAG: PQQ-like beta-propeller repeat protein [Lentisphaeria bacterium]|nr:PQQ-like beta-propeller repeat protein [Lentisphaeria bacterium]